MDPTTFSTLWTATLRFWGLGLGGLAFVWFSFSGIFALIAAALWNGSGRVLVTKLYDLLILDRSNLSRQAFLRRGFRQWIYAAITVALIIGWIQLMKVMP